MQRQIRRLPRHALVTRLKLVGVRQEDIAARVGCSQATVSRVIARRSRVGPFVEAVWREIIQALTTMLAA